MTTQSLLQLVMMMLVMARMLGLFVGSLQTVTTFYRYRPFILKEENLNSQSPHGDMRIMRYKRLFYVHNHLWHNVIGYNT